MATPVLSLPGFFTLIVEMSNVFSPDVTWRNTWEIGYPGGPPANDNDPVIAGIKAFTRACLRTDAQIAKLTLRNWSQGPQPFANRANLWEIIPTPVEIGEKTSAPPTGFGGQGSITVGGEVVAFCRRESSGPTKASHLFLRGFLDAGDLIATTGGKWQFNNPVTNPIVTNFAAVVTAHLGPYLNLPLSNPALAIVHVGNHRVGPPFATSMSSVTLAGPSTNKLTRKSKK